MEIMDNCTALPNQKMLAAVYRFYRAGMKKRNVLFILLFLPGILSCSSIENKQQNKIVKISYSRYGGRAQTITLLEITEDSIFYQTGRQESPNIHKEKTSKEFWETLSRVDIKAFDKIESKESVAEVDGIDVEVSIATKQKTHSFLNGRIENSTKMGHFLALLYQKMSQMTEKENQVKK